MNHLLKSELRDLVVNPLAWASYAAWGAVWLTVSGAFGRPDQGFPSLTDGLLLAWLLCWMGCLLGDLFAPRIGTTLVAALTALTMLALWYLRSGSVPILMILLVTQFTVRLPPRWLPVALVALNAYFYWILVASWGADPEGALVTLLGMAGFQLF
ncbi:MAG: hypothetical protein ACPGJE_10620, partial [Wenzhouxiangellaceae bacterium]